jgi:hypothetical protein
LEGICHFSSRTLKKDVGRVEEKSEVFDEGRVEE